MRVLGCEHAGPRAPRAVVSIPCTLTEHCCVLGPMHSLSRS